jgi:hypothetical protein
VATKAERSRAERVLAARQARPRAERVVLAVRQERPRAERVVLAVRQAPPKRPAFFAVGPAQRR